MNEMSALVHTAAAWAPMPLALATVISTWGSAPRPAGSHMLIAADGRFTGSVSGGCVEADIMATAQSIIAGAAPIVRSYGVSNDQAWEVGLPCGGQISVLVQPVGDGGFSPALFADIGAAQTAGQRIAVRTDMASGLSLLCSVTQPADIGAFINIYRPPRRLLIVGAVQIAQSLAALATVLGYDVHVNDPRARFLTADRFPALSLSDDWPDDAVRKFAPNGDCAVITLSHDIKIDDPALIAALRLPTGYIAALGSRKSHAARCARLAAEGFSDHDLARIDGPAGLSIGAVGPAEIALSITAGMVAAFAAA